ncbi:MAG TPA: arginine--tRNA ligase [Acidimicrobiales bacterium]|nr:arginine--tRNA ligase [Acidimicrobiales bacterium]
MTPVADPIYVLEERGRAALVAAFGLSEADADPVVRRSPPDRDADYQANAALALSKKLAMKPREVAEKFVAALHVDDLCEVVEIAGPGFVNFRLRAEALGSLLEDDERLGVRTQPQQTIVIDYSQPNVAKEMHVGHLRSTIIGDALVRIHEFLGHKVVRHNHIGDWGTPFGMLIEHLLDIGETEAAEELSVGDLDSFYKAASAKFQNDPAFADRARLRVVTLQSGDAETLRLWQLLVDESSRYFQSVYDRLGVRLTRSDLIGESFYNPWLDDVAATLEKQGLARVDEGALCVFPEGFTGRDDKPLPLIIRKRDGGYGYQATDLAAIRYRLGDLNAERLIYVVDAGQAQHLSMVFAVAASAGWVRPDQVEHVKFGLVLGPDGQRLRRRVGESVKLGALLDEAVERAAAVVAEKSPDLSGEEASAVARAVGIGAIKYADLSNDRVKDYIFDWDRMLAMEGNTGPYLQYAIARIRSIFRRAEQNADGAIAGEVVITQPAERELALALLSFEEAVVSAAQHLQPHRLCTYLFGLASTFTSFYEHCPVLRADSEEQRASRLKLCDLTARTLELGLSLLGIESPPRM